MYRTVITIPDETKEKLIILSKVLNTPRAQLMREAIDEYTTRLLKQAPRRIQQNAQSAIKEIENLSDLL